MVGGGGAAGDGAALVYDLQAAASFDASRLVGLGGVVHGLGVHDGAEMSLEAVSSSGADSRVGGESRGFRWGRRSGRKAVAGRPRGSRTCGTRRAACTSLRGSPRRGTRQKIVRSGSASPCPAGQSDLPGRSASASASGAPTPAAMVGNRSTSETGCRTTSPRATSGPAMRNGNRGRALVHQVLAPHPVVAQHLPVIACVNDPGRAFQPLLGQRPQHRPDLAVQVRAHGQVGGDGAPDDRLVEFFIRATGCAVRGCSRYAGDAANRASGS